MKRCQEERLSYSSSSVSAIARCTQYDAWSSSSSWSASCKNSITFSRLGTGCVASDSASASAGAGVSGSDSPGCVDMARILEGCLDRAPEGLDPERALQARGDPAVAAEGEEPRLALEVERAQLRAQPLLDVVVHVDL